MYLSQQAEGFLKQRLGEEFHINISSLQLQSIGGGSINNTFKLLINHQQTYFLKVNSDSKLHGLFEKEKSGLEFLRKCNCINIPQVVFCDKEYDEQFLLLEWINAGHRNEKFWQLFGENLARLHHCTNDRFGLHEDNYMGALPQLNNLAGNWNEFFINYRLTPQVELAIQNNLLSVEHVNSFENLFKAINTIFNDEKPSLLHGDLWSGNFMCNERSEPVLIDPAVYFGHRSMDLAMTTLFGGFDKAFYDSYHYHFPLPGNYEEQWEIGNLYPLLIHLNLFGESYLYDIISTLKKFDRRQR